MHDAPKAEQDLPFDALTKFSVAYRLLREDGFSHVIRCESVADKRFKVFFASNSKGNARLGIIASKRTLPSAVDRNRIKRIIRAAFRQHNIKVCKLDLVVVVRRALPFDGGAQSESLETLFNRVKNRCAEL